VSTPGRHPLAPLPEGGRDRLAALFGAGRHVACVNWHTTPLRRRDAYAAQVAGLAARFEPMTPDALERIGEGWRPPRPLLMPILYEGFRDNLDVILPLLEEAGFTAWLAIPPGFLDVEPVDQRLFAATNTLIYPEDSYPGERIVMTWDELGAATERGHTIVCHSRDHAVPVPGLPEPALEWEIASAQALFERRIGLRPDIFCWRRGAGLGVEPRADAILKREGFRWLLSNFSLQRIPQWPR
jgi:hypothetical protein